MISLLILAQFITATQEDPITMEKQAFFVANDPQGTLTLACRPGKAEIEIAFSPEHYYGHGRRGVLWEPNATHRFGNDSKPEAGGWYLGDDIVSYIGPSPLGNIKDKADFIDSLAKNSVLNLRIEPHQGEYISISFGYSLNVAELRNFMGVCNPQKVNARLREIGSPAAP